MMKWAILIQVLFTAVKSSFSFQQIRGCYQNQLQRVRQRYVDSVKDEQSAFFKASPLYCSKHRAETATTETSIKNLSDINNNRREMLTKIISSVITTASAPLVWTTNINSALAAPSGTTTIDSKLLDEKARMFKQVPVFALVSDEGTPFMILQNTGAGIAYFFTSYEGAKVVLDDAIRDAKDKDLDTQRIWNEAKISAVPLEFALKLQKGRPRATAQNGRKYDTVYDIIATAADFEEAGRMDKSGFFSERGRVPIFYSDDFKVKPAVDGGEQRYAVFFQKEELLIQYIKKYPDSKSPPTVEVADLIDTFNAMTNTALGGSNSASDRSMGQNIYLFPSAAARRMAAESEKIRGSVPPYKTGEMVAVGGK